jgi:uncharacterized membrane protein YgcG
MAVREVFRDSAGASPVFLQFVSGQSRHRWAAAAVAALLITAGSLAVAVSWPRPRPAVAPPEEIAAAAPTAPDEAEAEPESAEKQLAAAAPPGAEEEEERRPAPSTDPRRVETAAAAPQPPAVRPPEPAPAKPAPPRQPPAPLDTLTEDGLRERLATAPEVGLSPGDRSRLLKGWAAEVALDFQMQGDVGLGPGVLLRTRPDLATLPIRYGRASRISETATVELHRLSQHLHKLLDMTDPTDLAGKRGDPAVLRQVLRGERLGCKPVWLRPEAIPTLLQILMPEGEPVRAMLVELLADIDGRAATVALAQRAVFDLSADVRRQAVAALQRRPREDARLVFLGALRYPWAPPAQHAAEALVALRDEDSVPHLVALLKEPTPLEPFRVNKERWAMHEVVGLRHVANCLACHPPALSRGDPVPGLSPGTGGGRSSRGGAGGGWKGGGGSSAGGGGSAGADSPVVVRADVAYLRQDFSVQQDVPLAGAQARVPVRFDYLVRTRLLAAREAEAVRNQTSGRENYPQRQAVLYALRELTGRDAGPTTAAWEALYPGAESEAQVGRLTLELLAATGDRRDTLLVRYRDRKGVAYTDALAAAIPRLPADVQKRARALLAERLTRMTANTLRAKLADDDTEIRRAAVVACARREDAGHVPDLIALLDDNEPAVVRLAQDGLKKLTGQALDGAEAWKAWWQNRAGE